MTPIKLNPIRGGELVHGLLDCLVEAGQRATLIGGSQDIIMVVHPGWDSHVQLMDDGAILVTIFRFAHGGDSINFFFQLNDPDSVDKVCQVLNRGPWWKTSDTKS